MHVSTHAWRVAWSVTPHSPSELASEKGTATRPSSANPSSLEPLGRTELEALVGADGGRDACGLKGSTRVTDSPAACPLLPSVGRAGAGGWTASSVVILCCSDCCLSFFSCKCCFACASRCRASASLSSVDPTGCGGAPARPGAKGAMGAMRAPAGVGGMVRLRVAHNAGSSSPDTTSVAVMRPERGGSEAEGKRSVDGLAEAAVDAAAPAPAPSAASTLSLAIEGGATTVLLTASSCLNLIGGITTALSAGTEGALKGNTLT